MGRDYNTYQIFITTLDYKNDSISMSNNEKVIMEESIPDEEYDAGYHYNCMSKIKPDMNGDLKGYMTLLSKTCSACDYECYCIVLDDEYKNENGIHIDIKNDTVHYLIKKKLLNKYVLDYLKERNLPDDTKIYFFKRWGIVSGGGDL